MPVCLATHTSKYRHRGSHLTHSNDTILAWVLSSTSEWYSSICTSMGRRRRLPNSSGRHGECKSQILDRLDLSISLTRLMIACISSNCFSQNQCFTIAYFLFLWFRKFRFHRFMPYIVRNNTAKFKVFFNCYPLYLAAVEKINLCFFSFSYR
jgi:hypothetical protein